MYVNLLYVFKGDVKEVIFDDIVEELGFLDITTTQGDKITVIRAKRLQRSRSESTSLCQGYLEAAAGYEVP